MIDPELVEQLALIHCTVEEIAAVVGCSKDTLERRFAAAIENGRHQGKATLRRVQWTKASGGNATMLIWLGKQLLGQKDIVVQEQERRVTKVIRQIVTSPGRDDPSA